METLIVLGYDTIMAIQCKSGIPNMCSRYKKSALVKCKCLHRAYCMLSTRVLSAATTLEASATDSIQWTD